MKSLSATIQMKAIEKYRSFSKFGVLWMKSLRATIQMNVTEQFRTVLLVSLHFVKRNSDILDIRGKERVKGEKR